MAEHASYAVTFEFPMKPPVTVRGEVSFALPEAGIGKAARDAALKATGIRGWSSIVVVLDRTPKALETSVLENPEVVLA